MFDQINLSKDINWVWDFKIKIISVMKDWVLTKFDE